MTRVAQLDFRHGMVSDNSTEGSLFKLHDAYIRRANEICTRGPVVQDTMSLPDLQEGQGYSGGSFHPNFGIGLCRQVNADAGGSLGTIWGNQLIGGGLSDHFDQILYSVITENGPGTLKDQVCRNAQGNSWLPFEECQQVINTGKEMVFVGKEGSVFKWGGSHAAPVSTGTVTVETASSGSRVITCSGAHWNDVEPGQYILIDNIGEKSNGDQRAFLITERTSTNIIEIESKIHHPTGGLTYRIQSVAVVQSPDGVWNKTNERPTSIGVGAFHNNGLWLAGVSDEETSDYNSVFDLDKLRFSGTVDESSNFFSGMDLWHNYGNLTVFPGIGGRINGLASFGNELVVIKAHGLFRVTGSSSYNALAQNFAIQVISETVGAEGLKAWAMTPDGVMVANSDGVYLYDGTEVVSLTNNRIQTWWNSNFRSGPYVIIHYHDKILIQRERMKSGDPTLIWDINGKYFWTATLPSLYMAGVTVFNQQDAWVGQAAFAHTDHEGNAIHTSWLEAMTALRGVIDGTDHDGSMNPKPDIATHPIPIGDGPMEEGRVNTILIHAMMDTESTEELPVFIESGSTDDASELYSNEYGIALGTTDRIHRIDMIGMGASPTARIRISEPSGGKFIRIYGIGIDFEKSSVQGPS